jgi:lipoate-protein ligase A
MKLLDLTLDSPAANVALDEALLESAEQRISSDDVLRLWEANQPFVVIGRSSIVANEVNVEFCNRHGIPIIRRSSGGAAIVTGPGCLMYAVVLNVERWPQMEMIDAAHRSVLSRLSGALHSIGISAHPQGTSDLAIGDRKISGNSLRRKRHWILYHGTLLYGLSGALIEQCLNLAPRQPEYRRGRSHADFVSTISASPRDLKAALISAWKAESPLTAWPATMTKQLLQERYEQPEWNFAR